MATYPASAEFHPHITMIKIHSEITQQSPEWFELRQKYILSASNAQAIGNNGKGLESLVWEKLAEKHSAADKEQFSNPHTDRGNELEDQARELYMLETGNKVETVGFITDEEISKVGGASPDGLVNDDGLYEGKAFDDTKHFKMTIDFLRTGAFEIESKYRWQMQQQILFSGRQWCDFCAYNPNFKKSLLIQRVYPDPAMQAKIREGLKIGEKLIAEIEANLK